MSKRSWRKKSCETYGKPGLDARSRLCHACYRASLEEKRKRNLLRNAIAGQVRGDRRRLNGGPDDPARHWIAPARVTLPTLKFLSTPVEGEKLKGDQPLRLTAPRRKSDAEPKASERVQG
jgi:hypothetical protein